MCLLLQFIKEKNIILKVYPSSFKMFFIIDHFLKIQKIQVSNDFPFIEE